MLVCVCDFDNRNSIKQNHVESYRSCIACFLSCGLGFEKKDTNKDKSTDQQQQQQQQQQVEKKRTSLSKTSLSVSVVKRYVYSSIIMFAAVLAVVVVVVEVVEGCYLIFLLRCGIVCVR